MAMRLGDATIATGTISDDVRQAQQILQAQGYRITAIDGNFGPETQAAVIAFQTAHGLQADGIVGPNTWGALRGQAPAPTLVAPAPLPPAPRPVAAASLSLSGSTVGMVALGVGALFLLTMMGSKR